MYQDKLAHLKKQLQQLEDGILPEFLKRKKKIEQQYKERLKMADIFKDYEVVIFRISLCQNLFIPYNKGASAQLLCCSLPTPYVFE